MTKTINFLSQDKKLSWKAMQKDLRQPKNERKVFEQVGQMASKESD